MLKPQYNTFVVAGVNASPLKNDDQVQETIKQNLLECQMEQHRQFKKKDNNTFQNLKMIQGKKKSHTNKLK
jgi:hypothetical protein